MLQNDTYEYAVRLRREIHEYPEIGFDLPKTLAVVRRELDALGIPYTEEYGKSSIVGTINPDCKGFTIGLRADMDALPIQEEVDLPFSSKIPGQMHACGHDVHTATLLAAAKELKAREKELTCRVKLLFTPAEEYIEPGCKQMVENGVMDDIDCAVALHVSPEYLPEVIRVSPGGKNANSTGIELEFFGKNAHAASQEKGCDAIAMAVQAYTALEIMVAKEFKAKEPRVFNVGAFNGGYTNNVVCDYCKMFCTLRTQSDEVTEKFVTRARQIAEGIAAMSGGTAKLTVTKHLPYVINDPTVTQKVIEIAEKLVGPENVQTRARGMGGEDFAFMSRVKPCCQFDVGCRLYNAEKAAPVHNPKMLVNERCLETGAKMFVQFVLDNMNGIDFSVNA